MLDCALTTVSILRYADIWISFQTAKHSRVPLDTQTGDGEFHSYSLDILKSPYIYTVSLRFLTPKYLTPKYQYNMHITLRRVASLLLDQWRRTQE